MQLVTEEAALAKFYTPDWLGEALISNLSLRNPRSILDLGCGEGALAAAARRRWKDAAIITVDIDADTHPRQSAIVSKTPSLYRHVVADALDPSLGIRAQLRSESVDLAICNPPFRRPNWRPGFGEILEAAGLSQALDTFKDATSDLLFIAQNMRYLRREGCMGLIVPDAIITGEKMKGVRQLLAQKIEKVIQLPRNAFSNTEAQTFILIIGGPISRDTIELRELASNGQYSPPIIILPDEARVRLDYRFHLSRKRVANRRQATLQELDVGIARGRLSSKEIRKARFNVFHTADFRSTNTGMIRFCSPSLSERIREKHIVAQQGDILLARVDRRLEEKIARVSGGEAALSDCVYRLRCRPEIRERVFAGLTSDEGKQQISALSRGNGPRHISIRSLLTISV